MEDDDFISKSERKRRMTALQRLGEELVELSPDQLARLALPEDLREAVLECRRLTKHEAIRRQMQYIGKLMRDLDAAPIAAQLAEMQAPSRKQTALFHVAERWRDDLMRDPEAVARFAAEFPAADVQRLRGLVESAHADKRAGRGPKNFRELFHALNTVIQEQARKP